MVPLREFEELVRTLMAFDALAKNPEKNPGKNLEKNVAR
jgi:2-dehydro-3-deoxyphosphooctonate aldolase (KDO 8-P synthase)